MSSTLDPARCALEEFSELPSDLQHEIQSEGRAIGQRVGRHAVQVLFGPPGSSADPELIRHASGVAIFTGSTTILATAWHVVEPYLKLLESQPTLTFQVGTLRLYAEKRLIWHDRTSDIAFLSLESHELDLIPALTWLAPSWPPPPPAVGDYVAFVGYPTDYRRDLGPGRVELTPVGGLMPVTSAAPGNLKCVLPRETLVAVLGSEVPAPGTDLGGMSGGPVFRVRPDPLELVGIITDFGQNFDMFWMASLSDTPQDLRPSNRR
jgi:S1-C subfamily serine protease